MILQNQISKFSQIFVLATVRNEIIIKRIIFLFLYNQCNVKPFTAFCDLCSLPSFTKKVAVLFCQGR